MNSEVLFGIVRGCLATMIYPSLIAQLGFYFGMRFRSQTQAVLMALALMGGLCAAPILLSGLFAPDRQPIEVSPLSAFLWLSPVIVITTPSIRDNFSNWYSGAAPSSWHAWFGLICHFVIYGQFLLWMRWRNVKLFPICVERNDGKIATDVDVERSQEFHRRIATVY